VIGQNLMPFDDVAFQEMVNVLRLCPEYPYLFCYGKYTTPKLKVNHIGKDNHMSKAAAAPIAYS
jgi:hypothetical protein